MKVVITDNPPMSAEEVEIAEKDGEVRDVADATPEEKAELRDALLGCQEIHIPQRVIDDMKEKGINVDEVIAAILKNVGAVQ